jgi:hypothetical protein
MEYKTKEVPLVVKDRWRALKAKYPITDLKAEYGKWLEWRRSKGMTDPPPTVMTLTWFENDRLKNKPIPKKRDVVTVPDYTTYANFNSRYFSGQTAQILEEVNDRQMLTSEISTLIQTCVTKEGLSYYDFKDMISGQRKPVYPNTRELIERLSQ